MPRLAIFDFDHTLIRGDAGILFAHWMLGHGWLAATEGKAMEVMRRLGRMGLMTTGLLAKEGAARAAHAAGGLSRRELVRRAYAAFEGHEAEWMRARLDHFARRHLPRRTNHPVVARLRGHIDAGDPVIILSSGIRDLIWPWREEMRVPAEVVACELEEDRGTLTGRVWGPLAGRDKLLRALAIAKRCDLPLETAAVYTDHHDDLPLLDRAGEPVAVRPTRQLARVAKWREWEIL